MSQALHYLDLTELADLIAKRAISSVEVTRAQLERIAELGRKALSSTLVAG